jgi:hypothetical protein
MVRNAAWRVVQALARKDAERAVSVLADLGVDQDAHPKDEAGEVWNPPRIQRVMAEYFDEYDSIVLDADARSPARAPLEKGTDRWLLRQTISDPEEHQEWALCFGIDLAASRDQTRPIMDLVAIERPSS